MISNHDERAKKKGLWERRLAETGREKLMEAVVRKLSAA